MTKKTMKVNFSPTLYNQITELLVIESKLLQAQNLKLHGWKEDYTFDPTKVFKKEYSRMRKLSKNINDSITKYYPYLSDMKITTIRDTNINFENKIGNQFNCSYYWYIPEKLLNSITYGNDFDIIYKRKKKINTIDTIAFNYYVKITINTVNLTKIILFKKTINSLLSNLINKDAIKIERKSNTIIVRYNKESRDTIKKELSKLYRIYKTNKIYKNNRGLKKIQIRRFENQLNLIYNKNEEIIKYNVYRLILELYSYA